MTFEQNARAATISDQAISTARYALCAVLDDSASATPWGRDWARRGLLADLGEEAGADGFFERLDKILGAPARDTDLLEFFYVCLALGFEGRYRSGEGGRQALAQIRTRVHEAISHREQGASFQLSSRWRGAQVPARRVPGAIALWGVASVCALGLAALYFAYSVSLGALSDPVARELATLRPVPLAAGAMRPAGGEATAKGREIARAIGLHEVEVTEAAGAVIIVLKADELFASGSARLHDGLEPVILKVAEVLDRVPGAVVVTGHTDDVPIRTARFPSNWELSAERARSVVRLMGSRIRDAARLSAEGLADSQPLVPNDSAANRARNRRVTILLRAAS